MTLDTLAISSTGFFPHPGKTIKVQRTLLASSYGYISIVIPPVPSKRKLVIAKENRVLSVSSEDRRIQIPVEDRHRQVEKENRIINVPKEDRRIKIPKENRRIKARSLFDV
jgi:hypothetical protein